MNIWQAIIEALESINASKLRSGLTILGIVIGVSAVIAMLGVGQGARNTILNAISGIGSNLLFVLPGNSQANVRNPMPLTMQDAAAISNPFQAPDVQAVAPVIDSTLQVSYSGNQTRTQVIGVTPAYQQVRNETLLEGSFISQDQDLGLASVAIVGTQIADQLFGRSNGLVGETFYISGQPFRIIGVLTPKGGSAFGSQDTNILIPISTARARLIPRPLDSVDLIYASATSANTVNQADNEITQILRFRHHITLGPNDFRIFTQEDFISTAGTITGIFTIVLGGIAGISLLVGGIGIMNIMLVSVTERTREIGLRKAIGARKRDILIQFLTESALLSLIGGLIGIAFGYVLAAVIGRIAAASGSPFSASINIESILLATLFSAAVGLFFGIYPANRAANLEPVEALRYE
jgi:putative ABC transport system permease protein